MVFVTSMEIPKLSPKQTRVHIKALKKSDPNHGNEVTFRNKLEEEKGYFLFAKTVYYECYWFGYFSIHVQRYGVKFGI